MKKVYENASCKVFPGFYESLLYNSDTLYNLGYGELPEGYCWEFVKGGYQNFCKETCEDWVFAMQDALENSKYADHDNPIGLKIGKYCGMWSPKEYNFYTDRIQFNVEVNLNKLKEYCWKTCREEFDKYLFENWSDRPGFWSFVPNHIEQFVSNYKNDKDKDRLIDIMIEWYLLKFIDFEDVEYSVLENDYERLYENITLQSEDDWSLWDFEYDNEKGRYVPIHKLEVA